MHAPNMITCLSMKALALSIRKEEILETYTSACMYTSEPRLTNVLRLVTLFFSRFSMFFRKSEL